MVIVFINSLMVLGVIFSNFSLNYTIPSPRKLGTEPGNHKVLRPIELVCNKDLKPLLTPLSTDFCASLSITIITVLSEKMNFWAVHFNLFDH